MKNKVTIDITHVATLANMTVPESFKDKLEKQIESTVEHVESLSDIDTSKVAETNEVTNLSNVTEEDCVRPSLTQEEALMNATHTYNGFFVVDAVLPEE